MLLEREGPLMELTRLAQRAAEGRGGTVLVMGEAGIGKSALLHAFAQQHRARRVLWGYCEPLSAPRPLGPLQDMATLLDDELAALIDAGAPPPRVFARLLDDLQQAVAPNVLIFEDVHWADGATLDLVRYLGRRLPALPVLLILSLRSDEVAPDHPLACLPGDLPTGALTRIELAPLSVFAVEQMAQAAGRDARGVHERTAGNPFFVSEILAATGDADAALPVSVRDAVWARLARLDAQERWMLDLISVIPGAVERALWTALRAEDVAAVERCIARGILVRDAAGALAFRHELARQAVLARLDAEEQRHLHAHVLALLERYAPMVHASLAQLAHHAVAAADAQRVLALAPRAAAEAAALGAHRQAAQQLQAALRYAAQAPVAVAAQLHQDWAYETALAVRIDEAAIAARHQAIALWREAGRADQVGHNLRWLSRLHWYRGDGQQAEAYADAAVRELEALPAGAELAMAWSVRSQLHMLHARFDLAIEWGERALALAEQVGDPETRVHALNNIGTAQLFGAGNTDGRAKLEESLRMALAHGYHEHAARAYTNLGEWAVVSRQFEWAERVLGEGMAFDRRHDLDAWTFYLQGWQARLRMYQGRLREAEAIAGGVLAMSGRSAVERMPAAAALGRIRARMGAADAPALLQDALRQALSTGETQRIAPLRLALVEAAWLSADAAAMREQLDALASLPDASPDPWECGEMQVWWRRAGCAAPPPATHCVPAAPWAAELAGDPCRSAQLWESIGAPIEAALALMQVRGAGAGEALARAMHLLQPTGAQALIDCLRRLARERGVESALPRARRGHYGVARAHPLGLTRREMQVLQLLCAGHGNQAIARQLSRSPRTVEHHIASVYAKFTVNNRVELLLRLHGEPWVMAAVQGAVPATEK
ncbi:MAG: AAA family ATPase [Metallibacterium scheffleri]|jgi:DNA-binding CsgD family transcriptional regulator|uniref:ATP-binding protein n=1 Tax=Metallibacterium scheffleri TaxID=993689 RepID=UPI0026EEAC4A|nr:LuxR family transcriptional regulator [Metallibacterium scheffleri]MCK9367954.1 AAA family ATPase [Metallibacterium scheffleri]